MANLDHTLSSLTLLEEEPWFPFFGGMVPLGRFEKWLIRCEVRVGQEVTP